MLAEKPELEENQKETGRIEAFSDGVFAIAITLLVLELKIPRDLPEGTRLLENLLKEWPSFLAFVTSFMLILIMWVNHHRLFTHIRRADHLLLIFNGLLLLGITFVPFPTAVVADFLLQPDATTATAFYSATGFVIAIFFNLLWRYASHDNRLLSPRAKQDAVKAITRAYRFGPLLYLLAFGLAFLSAPLSLALNLGLAAFFALPNRTMSQSLEKTE